MKTDRARNNNLCFVSVIYGLMRTSGSILLVLMIAVPFVIKGQYATDFSNLSFYNASSGLDDLHYDYGWTRSSSNVTLQTGGMTLTPTSNIVAEHFTTVAYNLSGNDSIKFSHRITNVGGSGTKTLAVQLINVLTGVPTVLSTISYINASQTSFANSALNITQTGLYEIRFLYLNTNIGGSSPSVVVNSFSTSATPTLLPVVFKEFTSKLENHDAILNWSTAMEEHIEGFEVEYSVDGANFQNTGFVQALGREYIGHDYEFVHFNIFSEVNSGVVYYRLKVVESDGSYAYSNMTEVIISNIIADEKITFNNPFNQILQINVKDISQVSEIIIKDLQGKEVISLLNQNMSNSGVEQINTSALLFGVYYMSVIKVNGTVESFKLIK